MSQSHKFNLVSKVEEDVPQVKVLPLLSYQKIISEAFFLLEGIQE